MVKKGRQIRAWVDPPPLWALPERKHDFPIGWVPNTLLVTAAFNTFRGMVANEAKGFPALY